MVILNTRVNHKAIKTIGSLNMLKDIGKRVLTNAANKTAESASKIAGKLSKDENKEKPEAHDRANRKEQKRFSGNCVEKTAKTATENSAELLNEEMKLSGLKSNIDNKMQSEEKLFVNNETPKRSFRPFANRKKIRKDKKRAEDEKRRAKKEDQKKQQKKALISLCVLCVILLAIAMPLLINEKSQTKETDTAVKHQEKPKSTGSIETTSENISIQGELIIKIQDVGEGDSTFIILPNKETVLIDAVNPSNAKDIIELIKSSGYNTLDYIVATQTNSDYIGGMADVIEAFNVKNIYMPKEVHTTKIYEDLLDIIDEKGFASHTAKQGVSLFDYGNLKAEFLAPNGDNNSTPNESSVVLRLTYDNKKFLFMGDTKKEVEDEILASGQDVSADVLMIGHHGSNTAPSPNFISAVHPSIAVISVGKNSYGYPTSEILSVLSENNAEIWRTDEKGTTVISYAGVNIYVRNIDKTNQANAPPDELSKPVSNADKPADKKTDKSKEDKKSSSKDNEDITVYITKSGTKYHCNGCSYLKGDGIPISLKELPSKYDPCSRCNPPEK